MMYETDHKSKILNVLYGTAAKSTIISKENKENTLLATVAQRVLSGSKYIFLTEGFALHFVF